MTFMALMSRQGVPATPGIFSDGYPVRKPAARYDWLCHWPWRPPAGSTLTATVSVSAPPP